MIKQITKDEIAACVEVIKESFLTVAKEYNITYENAPRFTAFATTIERFEYQYSNGQLMFAYLSEDMQIIGYYSICLKDNNECELNNLCVLPQYRHKKIGNELIEHAFKFAKDIGCKQMNIGIIEENAQLRKWYESYGAIHKGTTKFEFFPFTCGYMKKEL